MKDFKNDLENAIPGISKHAKYLARKYGVDHEDLLQRTVVRAIEKQHQFDGRYFEAWLKQIMTNLAIDDFRKNRTEEFEGEEGKHLKKAWRDKSRWVTFKTIKDKKIENSVDQLSDISFKKTQQNLEDEKKEEQINSLINCIRKLDKKCQEILFEYLREKEGASQKELSKRLSIPTGTVASRFQRCLIKLSKIVKKLSEFNKK